jgi:LemA protein
MSKGKLGCLVAIGLALPVLVLVGGSLAGRYNQMVRENEQIDAAWAQVQNVLQRRSDLIPNLVETVKGFAAQERTVFEQVSEARSRLAGAATPREAAAANAGLGSALGRLLAIAEAYPELKSNQNFIRLQDELTGSENRVAVERRSYNDTVRAYNTYIKAFPNNFLARLFGFSEREYFEAEEGAQEVPKVQF